MKVYSWKEKDTEPANPRHFRQIFISHLQHLCWQSKSKHSLKRDVCSRAEARLETTYRRMFICATWPHGFFLQIFFYFCFFLFLSLCVLFVRACVCFFQSFCSNVWHNFLLLFIFHFHRPVIPLFLLAFSLGIPAKIKISICCTLILLREVEKVKGKT